MLEMVLEDFYCAILKQGRFTKIS